METSNPTPTGEAIEEEFEKLFVSGKLSSPIDIVAWAKEKVSASYLAGRQSMVEEIEGSLPAFESAKYYGSSDERERGHTDGFGDFRAQVLEIIAKKKGT